MRLGKETMLLRSGDALLELEEDSTLAVLWRSLAAVRGWAEDEEYRFVLAGETEPDESRPAEVVPRRDASLVMLEHWLEPGVGLWLVRPGDGGALWIAVEGTRRAFADVEYPRLVEGPGGARHLEAFGTAEEARRLAALEAPARDLLAAMGELGDANEGDLLDERVASLAAGRIERLLDFAEREPRALMAIDDMLEVDWRGALRELLLPALAENGRLPRALGLVRRLGAADPLGEWGAEEAVLLFAAQRDEEGRAVLAAVEADAGFGVVHRVAFAERLFRVGRVDLCKERLLAAMDDPKIPPRVAAAAARILAAIHRAADGADEAVVLEARAAEWDARAEAVEDEAVAGDEGADEDLDVAEESDEDDAGNLIEQDDVEGEDEYRDAPPAWLRVDQRAVPAEMRNEPCPCGSGRKYKKCCGVPRIVPPERSEFESLARSMTALLLGEDFGQFGEVALNRWDRIHLLAASFEEGLELCPPPAREALALFAGADMTIEGETLLETLLRGGRLSAQERAVAERLAASCVSVWRVEDVAGDALRLTDLVRGGEAVVREPYWSRLAPGALVAARLIELDGALHFAAIPFVYAADELPRLHAAFDAELAARRAVAPDEPIEKSLKALAPLFHDLAF